MIQLAVLRLPQLTSQCLLAKLGNYGNSYLPRSEILSNFQQGTESMERAPSPCHRLSFSSSLVSVRPFECSLHVSIPHKYFIAGNLFGPVGDNFIVMCARRCLEDGASQEDKIRRNESSRGTQKPGSTLRLPHLKSGAVMDLKCL